MIALMKKVRIAILDSGVCKDHSAFKNKTICGFSLCVENGKVNYYDDFSDDIGHGTAVFYLIERKLKDVCITNIKIYDIVVFSHFFVMWHILPFCPLQNCSIIFI